MTCTCNFLSPFRWQTGEPSVFASDSKFCIGAKTGKTASQIASAATDRVTRETGRSPGTIFGISEKSDRMSEEMQRLRKAAAC